MRVLVVAHGHPALMVGGAEIFAYDLYRGLAERSEVEAWFLARAGIATPERRGGAPIRSLSGHPREALWYAGEYDAFFLTLVDKSHYTVHLRRYLEVHRPDIVHVQHTAGLGLDVVRVVRRTLPDAVVVLTLHEFQPICHAGGLMRRTIDNELCTSATPLRCHQCFPDSAPQQFFLREKLVKKQLGGVDLFLAPSRQLLRAYVDWGIDESRVVYEEYGRRIPVAPGREEEPPVGNVAFLGQLAPHKGVLILLEAMKRLEEAGNEDVHLYLSGANLRFQESSFREDVERAIRTLRSVTSLGRYSNAEVADRLRDCAWVVVPSLWWENSPLVIQEAFMNHRPVVCSDIGGMAEKVRHGVNGLHFRVGDPSDLARTLAEAASSRETWRRLSDAIVPTYTLDETVDVHLELYRRLLDRRPVPAASLRARPVTGR